MPKFASCTLVWSPPHNRYELHDQARPGEPVVCGDDPAWFEWLDHHGAFAFHGQCGQLTMLKEARQRGTDGYWYAYRRQGRRTMKKYLGRSERITMARLEAIASLLNKPATGEDAEPAMGDTQEGEAISDEPITRLGNKHRAGGSAAPSTALLEPKLSLPRPQASLVRRERLLQQLDAGQTYKLTLVAGPAGFGKTTVVSQWISEQRTHSDRHLAAWVSLDQGDNDPVRFWRYVTAACRSLGADIGAAEFALHTPAPRHDSETGALETLLTTFLNALSHLEHPVILVLEDYHLITEPRIHETVAFWIDHLPATFRIVMLTRSEPPLPLARWRARNDVYEIQAAELRFTSSETAAFLQNTLPFALSAPAIQQLEAQLEGWPAGLRLVTLALKGHMPEQQVGAFLATFSGSHRHLLEYFVTEVLEAQAKSLQIFLLQTSILHRLTGSLCDAITGRSDSERLLELLERAGLFLVPLGGAGAWYRYHTFFAEAMQHEARRRLGINVLQECSRRARVWFTERGMFAEAVEVALTTQDYPSAAELIERIIEAHQLAEYQYHELYTLKRWLQQLPDAVRDASPQLCFTYANVLVFSSITYQLEPALEGQLAALLQQAEQGWQRAGNTAALGSVLAFRALLRVRQGAIEQAAPLASRALSLLPTTERFSESLIICRGILGEEALQAGHFDAAQQIFSETLALCQATGNRPAARVVMIQLAVVCYGKAEFHQAAIYYRQVLETAGDDLPDKAKAQLGLAEVEYAWNDLSGAERHAQAALEIGNRLADATIQVNASLVLARVAQASGATRQAQSIAERLLAHVPATQAPLLYRKIRAWHAELQLALGNISSVEEWIEWRNQQDIPLRRAQQEREALLVARWRLARAEVATALQVLNEWHADARRSGRTASALEIEVLMARAYADLEQRTLAIQRLRAVLAPAAAAGYLRLFFDQDETVTALLGTLVCEMHEPVLVTYLETVLTGLLRGRASRDQTQSLTPAVIQEPLSSQERRVLRLLMAGLSNPEIAAELVVSINTVKTHLRNIYHKLNVRTRAEARALAHQLDLR